jgi:hypothetical protein
MPVSRAGAGDSDTEEKGWVGDVRSPGASAAGTARSGAGKIGLTVRRPSTGADLIIFGLGVGAAGEGGCLLAGHFGCGLDLEWPVIASDRC